MSLSRTCSQCGNNGHNSRTCNDGENSIMIFGVRLTGGNNNNNNNNNTNPFRKSASLNNLSQYEQRTPQDSNVADAGYVSDDVVHASSRTRERKRGVPWTEEEHKLFLLGLQKVGKGDWRGISRNFVKTRTPTQVASHAQKYFLRRHNQNRRRRRSSLFDITTDTVMESLTIMEGEQFQQETVVPLPPATPSAYPASHYGGISGTSFPIGLAPVALPVASGERVITKPIRPTPMLPPSSKMANLNLKEKVSSSIQPLPLSLNLQYSSLPSKDSPPESSNRSSPSSSSSTFQAMSSGKYSGGGGDSNIISVA